MKAVGLSTAQSIIAVLVVIGSFVIIGAYIIENRSPDGYVIAIVAGSLSGVLGFYFGHSNGTTSALATAATTLANQVQQAADVQKGIDSVHTDSQST